MSNSKELKYWVYQPKGWLLHCLGFTWISSTTGYQSWSLCLRWYLRIISPSISQFLRLDAGWEIVSLFLSLSGSSEFKWVLHFFTLARYSILQCVGKYWAFYLSLSFVFRSVRWAASRLLYISICNFRPAFLITWKQTLADRSLSFFGIFLFIFGWPCHKDP